MSNDTKPRFLFWVDLETTGLDPEKDVILELAYKLTRFEFPYALVAEQSFLIGPRTTEPSSWPTVMLRELMVPAVFDMHTKSGLVADLVSSIPPSIEAVENILIGLTGAHGWPAEGSTMTVIAGSSVKFDHAFLKKHMPRFAKCLSYRNFDSRNLALYCWSKGMPRLEHGEPKHRAMTDLEASMDLVRKCDQWLQEQGSPLTAADPDTIPSVEVLATQILLTRSQDLNGRGLTKPFVEAIYRDATLFRSALIELRAKRIEGAKT